ncbi:ThiJ/PfpI family protein [Colletotrichum sojae]|uniref:ThiJ/PfpI family protein n=1 Tax=Colletotrichum sojae TaxID=2175907 RepID=A0A8H6IWM1_9PEZI|nr:ThiJ/PfpI family protein [Colletotrichum sojae]
MAKVLIIMADYGHDPTEVAVPYQTFKDAGFDVKFATETGKTPRCDSRMLEGVSQKLLGAASTTLKVYNAMTESPEMQNPLSWIAPGFTLDDFDVVHIPGGHDKSVRQLMDSATAQKLMADFFPKTKKPGKKIVAAICHGPLLLCNSLGTDGNSVLYHCTSTALPACFESLSYHGTKLFLGDYYKTYGAGSENVEDSMKRALKDPSQFKSRWIPNQPFVVEDPEYNYISARFPPDAAKFSEMVVNLVHLVQSYKDDDSRRG